MVSEKKFDVEHFEKIYEGTWTTFDFVGLSKNVLDRGNTKFRNINVCVIKL